MRCRFRALALITILAATASAHAQRRPFLTLEESVRASDAEQRERLGIEALDPKMELDRRVRQEMDSLNEGYRRLGGRNRDARIAWISVGGSSADPDNGVLLERRQVEQLIDRTRRKYGADIAESTAYLAAIGHERAHCFQFDHYGVEETFSYPTRVLEAQADIIAGTWFGSKVFTDLLAQGALNPLAGDPRFQQEYQRRQKLYLEAVREAAQMLGEHSGDDHPTSEQRSECFAQGLMVGLATGLTSQPQIPQAVAVGNDFFRKADFRVGREKMVDWSLRRAYVTLGIPEGTRKGGRTSGESGPTAETRPTGAVSAAVLRIVAAAPSFAGIRGERQPGSDAESSYYSSRVSIPGTTDATVHTYGDPTEKPMVTSGVYSGSDLDAARSAFLRFRDRLSEELPAEWTRADAGARETSSYRRLEQCRWTSPREKVELRLSLTERARSSSLGRYSVSFFIEAR